MAQPEEPRDGAARRVAGPQAVLWVLYLGLVAWAAWQWFAP